MFIPVRQLNHLMYTDKHCWTFLTGSPHPPWLNASLRLFFFSPWHPNVNSATRRAHWLHCAGHKPEAEHWNWWHWSNYCKELERVTSWLSWRPVLRPCADLNGSNCVRVCGCSSHWHFTGCSVCSPHSVGPRISTQWKGAGLHINQFIHFSKKSFTPAGISTRLSKHFHWIQAAAGHLKWSI